MEIHKSYTSATKSKGRLILKEGIISSEYGNLVSISSAVEEPGSKAEEAGKVFCACDYMVVLTQIRISLEISQSCLKVLECNYLPF